MRPLQIVDSKSGQLAPPGTGVGSQAHQQQVLLSHEPRGAAPHAGDEITAEAEVLEVRDDKPICTLRTTITNQDGAVVLDGTALVYREALG